MHFFSQMYRRKCYLNTVALIWISFIISGVEFPSIKSYLYFFFGGGVALMFELIKAQYHLLAGFPSLCGLISQDHWSLGSRFFNSATFHWSKQVKRSAILKDLKNSFYTMDWHKQLKNTVLCFSVYHKWYLKKIFTRIR